MFNDLKYFIVFIGTGRNGSSLVGSILDAHANVVVSHELYENIFSVKKSREQIFNQIVRASSKQAKNYRYKAVSKYKFQIDGQSQGKFDKILAIGDKKAVYMGFDKLSTLRKRVGLPLKFVYCIRNPYEAAVSVGHNKAHTRYETIVRRLQMFLERIRLVHLFILKHDVDVKIICLEDLIKNPKQEIIEIFKFLDLEVSDNFVGACRKLIFDKPHYTCSKIKFTERDIEMTEKVLNSIEYLNRYSGQYK